ncbi:uncharacterized protein DNG_08846 [Cephalotrichum gorgonifer]|uniref:Protein kinase domain-containing protein n=1 Tax=Cephalotrichum gorgonifer TaxID=2041049 RepID=A0AAE8N4X0_9PEZI|nr:uncharacterized protein DNG_08846 [Cephalotrichum gorgonifer]
MAELALGAVGVIGILQLCYKCGDELVATCKAFRDADARLAESAVRVEASWVQIGHQLRLLEEIAPLLDPRHRDVQEAALETLLGKLRVANAKLSKMWKDPEPHRGMEKVETRRFKFAIARKGVEEAVADLERWRGVFDPSWYLIMTAARPEIDRQLVELTRRQTAEERRAGVPVSAARYLRKALHADRQQGSRGSVFLAPDGLEPKSIRNLPYGTASTARRADNGQSVLLDPVTCTSHPSDNAVLKDMRNFARRLQHVDPFTFGLLECKGLLKHHDTASADPGGSSLGFSFVFRLPETHSGVQSLRSRLLGGAACRHESLSDRFDLARQVVRAVGYVHTYGFVHKNLRPENILVLTRGANTAPGETPTGQMTPAEVAVLVGFDILRDADGKTHRLGDDNWERNLYRHPSRQGTTPQVDYEMRHDIYSVGVCLLEIGLWTTFVDEGAAADGSRAGALSGLLGYDRGAELFRSPDDVKLRLLRLARGPLRAAVGTRYAEVVETCLTCLDADNTDFGDEDEFRDEDGVAVGVRYIEKVIGKLEEIVV